MVGGGGEFGKAGGFDSTPKDSWRVRIRVKAEAPNGNLDWRASGYGGQGIPPFREAFVLPLADELGSDVKVYGRTPVDAGVRPEPSQELLQILNYRRRQVQPGKESHERFS